MPDDIVELAENADLRARAIGPVVAMIWHKAPTRPVIEALQSKVKAHHDAHPGGVVLLVGARGGAPDDDARRAFKDLVKTVEKSILGAAVVIPIAGLRGKVVRAAVSTAVRALVPFPIKVVDSIPAAAQHAVTVLSQAPQRLKEASSWDASSIERTLRLIEPPIGS